jgi:hypothetical protein
MSLIHMRAYLAQGEFEELPVPALRLHLTLASLHDRQARDELDGFEAGDVVERGLELSIETPNGTHKGVRYCNRWPRKLGFGDGADNLLERPIYRSRRPSVFCVLTDPMSVFDWPNQTPPRVT